MKKTEIKIEIQGKQINKHGRRVKTMEQIEAYITPQGNLAIHPGYGEWGKGFVVTHINSGRNLAKPKTRTQARNIAMACEEAYDFSFKSLDGLTNKNQEKLCKIIIGIIEKYK